MRRLALLLAAFGAGTLLWLVAPAPWALAVAVAVASLPMAPAFATSSALIGEWAPPGTVTEAFTWNGTALTAGIAASSAATGALANAWPRAPFAVAAASLVLAAVWAAVCHLRRVGESEPAAAYDVEQLGTVDDLLEPVGLAQRE